MYNFIIGLFIGLLLGAICFMSDQANETVNDKLIAAAPDLLIALKKAVYELNAIRARDGVPWTGVPIPMPTSVTEEYFSSVVDECFDAIRKATL